MAALRSKGWSFARVYMRGHPQSRRPSTAAAAPVAPHKQAGVRRVCCDKTGARRSCLHSEHDVLGRQELDEIGRLAGPDGKRCEDQRGGTGSRRAQQGVWLACAWRVALMTCSCTGGESRGGCRPCRLTGPACHPKPARPSRSGQPAAAERSGWVIIRLRLAELGLVGAHLDGVKEGRVGPRRGGGARRRRREGREAGRRGTKGTGELRPPPSVQRHRRNRARGVEVLRAQNGLRGEGVSANERRNGENLVQHRCVGEGRRTRCVGCACSGEADLSRPLLDS